MHPTFEELLIQVKILTQHLEEALTENKTLRAKVKELEEKLNTNSSNSSKAPSQE